MLSIRCWGFPTLCCWWDRRTRFRSSFSYGLDIFWAVGRLWFETAEEFGEYAKSVVEYETDAAVRTSRQMALFAPRHEFDAATQLFCRQVAKPLIETSESTIPIGKRQKFEVQAYLGEGATKGQLNNVFLGAIRHGLPSVLLSGSHGMVFGADDPAAEGAAGFDRLPGLGGVWIDRTGALVCGLGPACRGGPARVDSCLVCVLRRRMSAVRRLQPNGEEAEADRTKAMLSRLPQALLAHRGGGALAVVCHVERAWAYSFQSSRGGPQVQGFRDVLSRTFRGDRLGCAMDQFNTRWAALSTELADVLGDMSLNVDVPAQKLASMWVARDDARNTIVFGDPAVRLRVESMRVLA